MTCECGVRWLASSYEGEEGLRVSKKATGSAAGNSEAIRIYEKMEEERKRKLAAKAEASKSKKVTLPRLKFVENE
jgi:hypothetical protein